jgi:hypothetical protein
MLDVDQRVPKDRPSSLAQWIYQAIGQPEVSLRVRLRGNNLHVLCESPQSLDATTVVNHLLKALKREGGNSLPIDPKNPIYQIVVYGRTLGRERPDWIKQVRLKSTSTQGRQATRTSAETLNTTPSDPALIISNESLARSGSPEAIARYLSETLSPLGVSVKVLIQELKGNRLREETSDDKLPGGNAYGEQSSRLQRRLWVICNSNYSPDASLLAEPVVQQLRSLQLKGFRDAALSAQVSGEAEPEWMLRVDLTPKEEMLKEWARWGDVQAIARRLNQVLSKHRMEVRAVLKESTLHLFCNVLTLKQAPAPERRKSVKPIAAILNAIAPQGIQAAAIYGVESHRRTLTPEQETPTWVEWLNLASANDPQRAESALSLAQKGNQEAISFLLQRLLNPDLDRRLATGGIHLKIRRKHDLLHIMSEAPICPPQAQVGPPIAKFLRQLAIPGVAGLRVYGRRAGATAPTWNYGVDFVHRRRLVPEATPEFAASDAYVNELMSPSGEPVLRPDLTKEDVESGLKQALGATAQTLQRWLCYSQLFAPTVVEGRELATVSPGSANERFSSSQGVKVAVVWGILGLLLTFQADRLMGEWLRVSDASRGTATEEPLTPIPLPQLSLQKSQTKGETNFNSSGFTRQGQTNVVINSTDNSSNPKQSVAATAALLAAARSQVPSFNNQLLDEKLALYQQRLLQSGPPDVLILGSSRAMRGVDPVALQDALAAQGYPDVEVFNFGINGATAQVVDLIVRRILTSEQLPKLIIWADGARAFNSGRMDATYNAIASSEGYQKLQAGTFPNPVGVNRGTRGSGDTAQTNSLTNPAAQSLSALKTVYQSASNWLDRAVTSVSATYPQRDRLKILLRDEFATVVKLTNPDRQTNTDSEKSLSADSIDLDGFLPLSIRFNPATYYKQHPRVRGDYDGDYESFRLGGEQDNALEALMQFAKTHKIEIVFANLPLTKDYLDPARTEYEEQFQRYMRVSATRRGLIFRDLTKLLLAKHDYFSDPSHLNRYGAYRVSNQLAKDPMIPWSSIARPQSSASDRQRNEPKSTIGE